VNFSSDSDDVNIVTLLSFVSNVWTLKLTYAVRAQCATYTVHTQFVHIVETACNDKEPTKLAGCLKRLFQV
jgi:hypothetical protein